ncbi:MAG: hypothetical protein AAF402_09815 [Pseudomonadota bacterium]
MPYLQKSLDREAKRIEAKIFIQDPEFAQKHKFGRGVCTLKLDGEPWLGDGPTSSRLQVVDYDETHDISHDTVRPLKAGGGFAIGRKKSRDNYKFHQVNVWAIIYRVLDRIESGWIFGRRIPWNFPSGRLKIYPHGGEDDNAYYMREYECLWFGYYKSQFDPKKNVYTCLCHDTVTHELGHAVLDGLKPLYSKTTSADCAGFHEYFGDALAMTSALTLNDVVVTVAGRAPKTISGRTLVSDIASEFGSTYPGSEQPFLRSAANKLTMDDVRNSLSEHARSEILTGAFYDLLQQLYQLELKRQKTTFPRKSPGQLSVAALFDAANATSRMMLRGIDYCPPAGLTYPEYARAVLRADEVAHPTDDRGYRQAARSVFLARKIIRSEEEFKHRFNFTNNKFRQPYYIEDIAASEVDAYTFIDRNRELLKIPRSVEFKVSNVYRTRKFAAAGYFPPREVIVEFIWAKNVKLSDKRFGKFKGSSHKLWCGGTLVFDANNNILHYSLAGEDKDRVDEFKEYILYYIENGWLEPQSKGAKPKALAKLENGELELSINPAMRHSGRGRKTKNKRK